MPGRRDQVLGRSIGNMRSGGTSMVVTCELEPVVIILVGGVEQDGAECAPLVVALLSWGLRVGRSGCTGADDGRRAHQRGEDAVGDGRVGWLGWVSGISSAVRAAARSFMDRSRRSDRRGAGPCRIRLGSRPSWQRCAGRPERTRQARRRRALSGWRIRARSHVRLRVIASEDIACLCPGDVISSMRRRPSVAPLQPYRFDIRPSNGLE